MRRAPLAILLVMVLSSAAAQETLPGGDPGVAVMLDGRDVADAAQASGAFTLDPAQATQLSVRLTPPPNTTWDVRSIRVGLVAGGGSASTLLSREAPVNTTIPPGFTAYVNRTIALDALKPLGVGLFRMEVRVVDAAGATLDAQTFYVRIPGNPFLTVAGAAVTAASAATAYGIIRLLRDLREMNEARKRHLAREESKRSRAAQRVERAQQAAGVLADLADGPVGWVAAAADVDPQFEKLVKRAPLAWTFTGLGLGAVLLSWAQFLGLVPFDLAQLALWALGAALLFLTASLVAVALAKRARRQLQAGKPS